MLKNILVLKKKLTTDLGILLWQFVFIALRSIQMND